MLRMFPVFSVPFCVRQRVVMFLGIFLMGLAANSASAQNNIDWQNEFDRCYALSWIYESDQTARSSFAMEERSSLQWYCQAKPKSAPGFSFRTFQSYQDDWINAVDFSMMRCEREGEACTYRCALAPRVCAPHFWP